PATRYVKRRYREPRVAASAAARAGRDAEGRASTLRQEKRTPRRRTAQKPSRQRRQPQGHAAAASTRAARTAKGALPAPRRTATSLASAIAETVRGGSVLE